MFCDTDYLQFGEMLKEFDPVYAKKMRWLVYPSANRVSAGDG